MGGGHRQDLTPDVTHLIVGDINTLKYKYVAKNRIDVKVVHAEWVTAMYEKWIDGEDINVVEFEGQYKYPPFLGLRVSVTNISSSDERTAIQKLLTSNGGDYHPDLTRQVTHLIAAVPEGRKYEFARQWQIRVVSPEWLFHSIERGMALDEDCYDPTLPDERIGNGARPEAPVVKKEFGTGGEVGDTSDASSRTATEEHSQIGKRKIREDFSRMMEAQSQTIWDDIMGQASNAKAKKRDEWDESREVEHSKSEKTRVARKRRIIRDEDDEDGDPGVPEEILIAVPHARQADGGMFIDRTFCIYGFEDEHKVRVLRTTIESHSGLTINADDLRLSVARHANTSPIYIVVPESFPKQLFPTLSCKNASKIVSFWWIERCLHRKQFMEPSHPDDGGDDIDILCFPFSLMPLRGFEDMEIVTTGFTGVNMMHVIKAIGLSGAKYKDAVNGRKTNIIISAIDSAKTDKAQAGLNWNIPVVTMRWLATCIKRGEWVEFDDFLVNGVRKRVRGMEDGERKRLRQGPGVGDDQHTLVLDGCVIAVSKSLQESRAAELKSLARSLGAIVVDKFSRTDSDLLTHLVHVINGSEVTSREYRVAKTISGCYIVSPVWLRISKELKQKPNEKDYPPTSPEGEEGQLKLNNKPGREFGKASQKDLLTSDSLPKQRRNPFEVDDSEAEASDYGGLRDLDVFKGLCPGFPGLVGSMGESDVSAKVPVTTTKPALTEILRFGIDKLSTALDKPRKPRGRLQGKATSNMSVFPDVAVSIEDSTGSPNMAASLLLQEGSFKSRESSVVSGISGPRSAADGSLYLTQLPPQSQAVSYADPEAQMERKRMMAKLDGVESVDTPAKVSRGAVVQDTYRIRRSARNQQSDNFGGN
ncbi:hypothetical protein L211DRAFT_40370 [Terfezia boudieri ATCC MYA-4762]|uniref:BRCT domain-containing protein n=1 Tax=Terfezia boudieri ATCC MYA-4762 TaxID=1051890 RepID=A0A3N4M7V2_9PEZI|nr:hypothetical protein L211DRAFT_40370 [Terfezia boudieri ATCC MYA-4762]